jgi:predicted DNA-binding transcriptional regulator YafY
MKHDISSIEVQRFGYIETLLAWTGKVYAGEVAEYFHVARQTAQGFINAYRKAYPNQMEYDYRQKRHIRSKSFKQILTQEETLTYLDFIRGQTLVGKYWDSESVSEVPLVDVDRMGRPGLSHKIVEAVLAGLSDHKRVLILYQNKTIDPKAVTWRMISPNHLVHADNRYHVRAYYHKNQVYRDFVLSRILDAEFQKNEKPEREWVSGKEDKAWSTRITLRFHPNSKLTGAQTQAVIKGYKLDSDGCLRIETNKALDFYVQRKMLSIDLKLGIARWCLFDVR